MPQEEDAVAPLLPRGATAVAPPAAAATTRGMGDCEASSNSQSLLQAAGRRTPQEEHITTVQNLYEKIESLEANINFVDNMLWVLGVLVLVAAVTLPEDVRNLWTTNSEQAIKRQATEQLKQVSSLLLDMSHELKEYAAAKRMAPVPVLLAATPAPSTTASDH